MDEKKYKSVLIVNESVDAIVTLYLYYPWDPICWLSVKSKIIKPKEKYLHRSETGFQYKLVARFEDNRQQKTVLDVINWDEDKLFKVTDYGGTALLSLVEGKLTHYPQEKRLCLRKLQRDKELKSTCGGRNLYDILGLNMEQIRKMSKDQQSKAIRKGYITQIRIWHPDHNGGDEEIAKEILFAYEILQDEGRRARYHNMADYDEGWSIFWPECVTEEQKLARRERMILFAVSALLALTGFGLTVFSAGLASPALVVGGAVLGNGFVGAGLQSLYHTLNKHSVADECRFQDWLMKAGIGFIGGAVTGGAAAGITSAVTGVGSTALESVAVTAGQYMGTGAATGAVGGLAQSLALDAGKMFVDEEDVTWKQMAGHALCSATIGAVAGAVGGAATKAVVGSHASAASANLGEGEIGEQLLTYTVERRFQDHLTRNISKALTENGTEAVMGSASQFAEERLDDSVENQSPGEHASNGFKKVLGSAVKDLVFECGSAVASHISNEIKVSSRFEKTSKPSSIDIKAKPNRKQEQELIDNIRYNLSRENNEHLHTADWRRGICSAKYQPLDKKKSFNSAPTKLPAIFEEEKSEEQDGKIKYISESAWVSAKMIVKYLLKDNKITQEVEGSGKIIDIPRNARSIGVSFKVRRPHWGDIFKYDRFRRCWCKPNEPHVFKYDTPPIRTFTIGGNLWCEAVMRVSDEYHEETNEL